ncbi:cpnB-1, partial [Symbiodinium sp. KB8]
MLVFRTVRLIKKPQLLDYIRGGCRINLITAIDFTASNGAPSTPASLHHMRPGYFNDYQNAIASVGSILQDY